MPPLQYLSTPESIPDKGVSGLKGDAIGNLNTNQQTLLAGERLGGSSTGSDYLAVKIENSYTNITTATTTVIKTGAGWLHTLTINTTSAGAITIYDNTAASGAKIGTLVLSAGVATYTFDVAFATGLTIVTAGASDLTIAWQ